MNRCLLFGLTDWEGKCMRNAFSLKIAHCGILSVVCLDNSHRGWRRQCMDIREAAGLKADTSVPVLP